MANYLEYLISNYTVENPLNKIIYEITSFIKNGHDYNSAIKLILDNNLKLEDIVNRTARLKSNELVELADKLISLKNNSNN